jgi:bifunctional non-homologous end joining protein LigD
MALETYRKKRNFRTTPEPRGRVAGRKRNSLSFVIQKHAASHLHYDFRLEHKGVLLSWAVPKGPSLDPSVKRLAMQVEDHPVEYGEFEGIIPPKQYGSGTVLLWDRGTWQPQGKSVADYYKGRLKFRLSGSKLHGGWMLVRSNGGKYAKGNRKAWLLIKERDEHARRTGSIVDEKPESVATGRTIEEIAADRDRVWQSNKSVATNVKSGAIRKRARSDVGTVNGARKASLPKFIEPQLATLVKSTPGGSDWLHEIKLDGYRMICRIEAGKVKMFSRNENDWTAKFPSVASALGRLPVQSAWIDGEVVSLQPNGLSSFQALQNVLSTKNTDDLYFYAFDLPYLDGYDLRRVPLVERKRLLEKLLAEPPERIRYSAHVEGSGEEFFVQGCKMKLEGVIAKRCSSSYLSGRGKSWVKVKCILRQEMVIGGFTDPEGSRTGLGALLLGVYEPGGKLRYSGKVGTGFNDRMLTELRKRLRPLERDDPPFYNPPRGAEGRRAHWVKPTLVGEVAFTEWTNEGTLRHPSFQGLRQDKDPRDVVRETPAATAEAPATTAEEPPMEKKEQRLVKKRAPRKAGKHGAEIELGPVKLSNPNKALYPESDITKLGLARYYQSVADWILPQLEDRPLALVRCPNGWQKQCFFQKNAGESTSKTIDRVRVQTSDGPAQYMMANSRDALTALVQMGVLEIHPWGSTKPKLGHPDRIVFDIDPDDNVKWAQVAEGARQVNALLEELGLRGFLKTTGGKGLHVVVPVAPKLPWDDIKGFSKAIADLFASSFPGQFTAKAAKAGRRGKMFIDYLRNAEGSTAICAYSARARENAPVATPLDWDELGEQDIRYDHFNISNVPARLKKLKKDPWADIFRTRQTVTKAMMKKVGYEPV